MMNKLSTCGCKVQMKSLSQSGFYLCIRPFAVDNVCTCTEGVNHLIITEMENLKVASDFGSYSGTE